MARKQNKMPARNKKNFRPTKSGAGMTAKGVAAYRRANPGSKLKTAVPGKVNVIPTCVNDADAQFANKALVLVLSTPVIWTVISVVPTVKVLLVDVPKSIALFWKPYMFTSWPTS